MSYVWRGNVFTGDALLMTVRRTDFQGGDAGALYDSVHGRLFHAAAPSRASTRRTTIAGNTVSTIGWEQAAQCDGSPDRSAGGFRRAHDPARSAQAEDDRRRRARQPGSWGSPPCRLTTPDDRPRSSMPRGARAKEAGRCRGRENADAAEASDDAFPRGELELVDTRTLAERDLIGYVPGSVPSSGTTIRQEDAMNISSTVALPGGARSSGRVPVSSACARITPRHSRRQRVIHGARRTIRRLRGRQERARPARRQRLAGARPSLAPGLTGRNENGRSRSGHRNSSRRASTPAGLPAVSPVPAPPGRRGPPEFLRPASSGRRHAAAPAIVRRPPRRV